MMLRIAKLSVWNVRAYCSQTSACSATTSSRFPKLEFPSSHTVFNQSGPIEELNLNAFDNDVALKEAVIREGAGWSHAHLSHVGKVVGSAETFLLAQEANRHVPRLLTHDRYGNHVDTIEFHPSYHELMRLGIELQVPSFAWNNRRQGSVVARSASVYLFNQADSGVNCPLTMTFAVYPALRHHVSSLGVDWIEKITTPFYDPRNIPVAEKRSATIGMSMTEKQGGSDVRANTTRAEPIVDTDGNSLGFYRLYGHKWFTSAPMCDAFLTLAKSESGGISCFLVPRWLPNGDRNVGFRVMRLKDKLGDRSNASSEIEYHGAWAEIVGEEGHGINVIMEMVNNTRLDCALGSAGLMRQGVVQAAHHVQRRATFGRVLADSPLMRNVVADLAVESEAATTMIMRIARAHDDIEHVTDSDNASMFFRLAVAVSKYWITKRCPGHVYEAMECLGGNGYVEDGIMPRIFRQSPLNSIWEGSGNIMCLDVFRTLTKSKASMETFFKELELSHGKESRQDRLVASIREDLAQHDNVEARARTIVAKMALALQGSLLLRDGADTNIAHAFVSSRLCCEGGNIGYTYGTLPPDVNTQAILDRCTPHQ